MFPAVLTRMCGVDKQIIRLMRDRTVGNTMAKVWRQVQESHCEDYLHRKDLYTTLLSQLNKPGGIIRTLSHQFQRPPTRRELPSPQLLRKAFLISEVENIEDYRTQIMSTFGKVLKYDSTRKICKKLAGEGKGRADWCTNVANELGQILMSVLTCEESLEKLLREWAECGMMVRLDIFHWIKRFDAAIRTDHHAKYALFKSALSAAVFSYIKDDMALLIQAIRAGHPTKFDHLTDA
ncbi:uncharacterized protein LOC114460375 isoform X4 [Gouania willdenowi]|uniref:uncharacterized protein LOC114460375 isoform X4 n=1 Tax=Gouania willdenowi TaxID=441366 RepID=UPI0010548E1E|nr:uncharacterized protein LOC114460375 isoform X4 [Gouania willdenowi]